MKKVYVIIGLLLAGYFSVAAQENIAAARALGEGAEVTVTGIVTNGDEFDSPSGSIRYFQDGSGGIAAYASNGADFNSQLSNIKRGDEVTITGILDDYNSLLEINPITAITVNSTGNAIPDPIILTPGQFAEEYEGMLVRIDNATFSESGEFTIATNYTVSANGEVAQLRITSDDLAGQVIPGNPVSIIAPLGSYNDTYQLLPRDQFDILSSSVINLTSVPVMTNLSTTGFTVSWTTDVAGTTEAFYGNTTELELGELSVAGETTTHSIDLTGLDPSELIYLQPFSVKEQDTIKAAVQVYITQSESSGEVLAYFNAPVDNSVSLGMLEAKYLDHAIDDTLIQYINRAEESIEFTIYNFNNNGISSISDALNAAYDRGVIVRVIYDSNIDAVGVESLHADIGRIASPQSAFPDYGIMHNKFVVFDANAADPDKSFVWTGATNFTDGQINTDPNNVIIVQDKSLAKAFQLEFNEMFGNDGPQPDASRAMFGPDKTDNTPHEFIIGGKRVECYFSPSDGTHNQILNTIATADHSIHIATMLITKSDIAYDLSDKNDAGVDVKVLINDFDQYGEPIVEILKSSLEDDIRLKGETGIMHHKYMIVDQGHPDSDPILLTGSHNWSSSAQFRNDENTLIFHSQSVANAYYQEFVERFSFGELVVPKPELKNDFVTMTGGSNFRYDVLYNDELPGAVNLSISTEPTHGTAKVETDNSITYAPDPGFNQAIDTVVYKVCLANSTAICDSALFVIYVNKPASVNEMHLDRYISVYPVPAVNMIYVTAEGDRSFRSIVLYDQAGRETLSSEKMPGAEYAFSVQEFEPGLYYLRMELDEGVVNRKIIIQ